MKYIVFVIFVLLFFPFCGTDESPLEKERRELNEELEENSVLSLYRGLKISIRSIPQDTSIHSVDSLFSDLQKSQENNGKVPQFTALVLKKIIKGTSDSSFTVGDYVSLFKNMRQLKSELKNSDEDQFPTILEIFDYLSNIDQKQSPRLKESLLWDNAKEHLLLALVAEGLKQLPECVKLYELSRLPVKSLPDTEIKPFSALFKGFIFMESKRFYLSDEALTQGLESLEQNPVSFEYKTETSYLGSRNGDVENIKRTELHALLSIVRSVARYSTGDDEMKEKSISDAETFLSDAQKLGLDNELVWIAGVYVGISRNEKEKTLVYLEKLRKSNILDDSEKNKIDEIKAYIEQRETENALNVVYDKIFIGKIVLSYALETSRKSGLLPDSDKNTSVKMIYSLPGIIEKEYQIIEKEVGLDKVEKTVDDLKKKIF